MGFKNIKVKRAYHRNYYRRNLDNYIQLLGGKCVDCGEKKDLEFDHIDRATKVFSISNFNKYSKSKILEELKKCVLRCRGCHDKKSLAVGDLPPRTKHGDYGYYRHHKCRCEKCRLANREYSRKYREMRQLA